MYETVFQECCQITAVCANWLNMTYGEFNVFAFLHVQPITYIIGCFCMFCLCGVKHKYIKMSIYSLVMSIFTFYYIYLHTKYPVTNTSFTEVYNDLHKYAGIIHISYIDINYLLFICAFIVIHLILIIDFVKTIKLKD